jgi:uncharacterized membrane protein YeaQ/YmgE (transglycosylase-associated protein family)
MFNRWFLPPILGAVLLLLFTDAINRNGWLTAIVAGGVGAAIGFGIALFLRSR